MYSAHRPPPNSPAVFRGFEGIHRFWDASSQSWVANILAGELYVTENDELISTVLGSCVAACIRDPFTRVGGMNHFMLPSDPSGNNETSMRFGFWALERLINEVLKRGGRRERLEVKIFGGGRMMPGVRDVGKNNVDFVRNYLAAERIGVVAEDVGDTFARKLRYHPFSGKALVKHLEMQENAKVIARERELEANLQQEMGTSDIELF